MKKVVLVLFLAFTLNAPAATRDEKIEALMQAQGLVATFEQQRESCKVQGRLQVDQVLGQIAKELNPSHEYQDKIKSASEAFLIALEPPWSAKDTVQSWSKHYGSKFTDAELDELLSFYTSPIAQKEVAVSRQALSEFIAEFQERTKPIIEKATLAYISDMKKIVQECACKK